MKKTILIALTGVVLSLAPNDMSAQTLRNYAKQRNQELAERQRQEKSNYEKACKEGTLSAYNEYLSMYPKGKYIQDVRSRIAEIERKNEQDMYDYACKVETSQSFEAYIKKYPNGRYVQEARGRLEDMELWKKAKAENTITAYRNYLSTSKNKSFSQLANDAITDLESKDAWNAIRHSTSKSVIKNFMEKYPKSSCLPEATKRYNELEGVELFENGDLQGAYNKFEAAGGRYAIAEVNRSKYDESLEFVDYQKLSSSSAESDLLGFLNRYPSSKYYNQVSNLVAVAKAKNFSMFSSSSTFNDAMSYAKDKYTKNTVQSYIDSSKQAYRHYKRNNRRLRHNANGKMFQLGFEMIDLGANPSSYDDYDNDLDIVWFYNVGLSLKIGNYKDPVQLEIGAKPGLMGYTLWHGADDESETKFHLPLYARLKLNLCDIQSNCKLYVDVTGYYNSVKEEFLENDYAISGGIGAAWHHWDWSVYYKGDLNNKYNLDNDFIGTSLKYYF